VNCSQLRHLIDRNPLSTLKPKVLEEIRSHAAICPACAEVLESVAELEHQLTGLPEIEVPTELCDRVMERISTTTAVPTAKSETRRTLVAHFLTNLSFVTATAALLIGVDWAQWLRNFRSVDFGFKLSRMLTDPPLSTSAGLTALACLLFLAGFALTERTSSQADLATRPTRSETI